MAEPSGDVLIVGAGPAGCAAAYDLLAAGRHVTLLDKCAFPRNKPCAGGLTVKTLRAIRYSLAPVIRATCHRFVAGLRLEKSMVLPSRTPLVAMTVREELDHFCLNRCLEAGAAFQIVAPIRAVTWASGRWTVATRDTAFTANHLIAADGANSQVRHLLQRGSHIRYGMALECCVEPGSFPQQDMAVDFGIVQDGYAWIFPKRDHLNVGLYSLHRIDHAKAVLDTYLERKLGIAAPARYFGHRIPYGGHAFTPGADEDQNLYFVGDAAGLIDPLMGEGIYHAIRSGQLAAAAILARASGQRGPRYAELIQQITRDLLCYWPDTQRFYAAIDRGYRHLTLPIVRQAAIKGYSLGLPIRQLKRQALLLPFMSPPDLSRHLAPTRLPRQ